VSRTNIELALVLSGGNALGAYQAGAYEALHEQAWWPDMVAGASVGAINGALICGNPVDDRLSKLKRFWRPEAPLAADGRNEEARRSSAAALTLAFGQPGLFAPRSIYGPWWNALGNAEPPSLYDALPLRDTLTQLVDFELLNAGRPRFSATATDIESGVDLVFDTHKHMLRPDHLRASSALLPVYSPVEIDGRLLADAGLSVNLPLDAVLCDVGKKPLPCVAIDLFPLSGPRPSTLGDTVVRMQDLLFATQSRRAIAAWQAIFDARAQVGDQTSVTLLHIAYADQSREVSGKAFDYSAHSAASRWQAGHADMRAALADIAAQRVVLGRPGLKVYSSAATSGASLDEVHWQLAPTVA
jgi:NTE family protein